MLTETQPKSFQSTMFCRKDGLFMDILEDMLHPEDLVIEAELAGAPEGQVPQSSHAHMMLCKLLQEHHTQHVLSKAKRL